jgi:hypothetical protein
MAGWRVRFSVASVEESSLTVDARRLSWYTKASLAVNAAPVSPPDPTRRDMSTLAGSESPSRSVWTEALLDLLRQPHEGPRHTLAAALLPLFAVPSRAAAIEAILLDRARDPWVRTYALRAMEHRSVPLTDEGLDRLLADFAADLAPPLRRRGPRRLSEIDGVVSAVALARSPTQRAMAARFLRELDGASTRELVLESRRSVHRFDAAMRDVLYHRCVEAGALDPELAWATLEHPESRAMALGALQAVDLDRLDRVTRDLDPETLAAIASEHPRVIDAAIEALALPVPFMLQHRRPEELARAAQGLVRDLDRGTQRARFWRPIHVLSALPTAAADLDALLHEEDLGEPVRLACASARLQCSPPPNFEVLPEQEIADFLRFLRPDPRHRPLFAWALASPHPAFQYAALRGLMALDQGHLAPAVIQRFRASEEPLLRLVALGAASRDGDSEAAEELGRAAHEAPHVVLRAQALRALRTSAPRPAAYLDLCGRALKRDKEVYDRYYAPATSEAALCLARHDATPESTALEALVDAGLDLTNDDAWWAIESSIRSWVDHSEASIHPLWYWTYLFPADRNDRPREAS